MMYEKTEKWLVKFEDPTGEVKSFYVSSKQVIESHKKYYSAHGFKFLSVTKLYPFSTQKNQHNFELIFNVCSNQLHDNRMGEVKLSEEEVKELCSLRKKADEFRSLALPVAWLPWETWKQAKEVSEMARAHRINACIAAGNTKYLQYC